jgi:hypothetical protein
MLKLVKRDFGRVESMPEEIASNLLSDYPQGKKSLPGNHMKCADFTNGTRKYTSH